MKKHTGILLCLFFLISLCPSVSAQNGKASDNDYITYNNVKDVNSDTFLILLFGILLGNGIHSLVNQLTLKKIKEKMNDQLENQNELNETMLQILDVLKKNKGIKDDDSQNPPKLIIDEPMKCKILISELRNYKIDKKKLADLTSTELLDIKELIPLMKFSDLIVYKHSAKKIVKLTYQEWEDIEKQNKGIFGKLDSEYTVIYYT